MEPVEARQPRLCGEPQVSVVRLDAIRRERQSHAILRAPDIELISVEDGGLRSEGAPCDTCRYARHDRRAANAAGVHSANIADSLRVACKQGLLACGRPC